VYSRNQLREAPSRAAAYNQAPWQWQQDRSAARKPRFGRSAAAQAALAVPCRALHPRDL